MRHAGSGEGAKRRQADTARGEEGKVEGEKRRQEDKKARLERVLRTRIMKIHLKGRLRFECNLNHATIDTERVTLKHTESHTERH
jgi:hypothetical protein